MPPWAPLVPPMWAICYLLYLSRISQTIKIKTTTEKTNVPLELQFDQLLLHQIKDCTTPNISETDHIPCQNLNWNQNPNIIEFPLSQAKGNEIATPNNGKASPQGPERNQQITKLDTWVPRHEPALDTVDLRHEPAPVV